MPRTQSLPSPGTNGQESSQWPPDTLAEAFAEKHERAWRYVPDHKEWFMWVPDDENTLRRDKSPWDGGGVWRRDASLQIEDSIRKFCRALGLEVTRGLSAPWSGWREATDGSHVRRLVPPARPYLTTR